MKTRQCQYWLPVTRVTPACFKLIIHLLQVKHYEIIIQSESSIKQLLANANTIGLGARSIVSSQASVFQKSIIVSILAVKSPSYNSKPSL